MAIGKTKSSINISDILNKVSEFEILYYYLNISNIPCLINSPLRKDKNPSFGLYTRDGKRVYYTDFSTKEKGNLFNLLSNIWNLSYEETLIKIYNDIPKMPNKINVSNSKSTKIHITDINNPSIDLQCKVRQWMDYDIEYWNSYGISINWLKYAEVYPISHKIIIKNNQKYVFHADKYAYAFVEHKEEKVTLKIYQPFNTNGYKWSNKHDKSVISLWTKVPEYGEKICICSSLKDALCLWSNLNIPSIAVQGEGYNISDTAINELKRRYTTIFICFDNDQAGLIDAEKLSKNTGFTNIIIPQFENGKDLSDFYKVRGKEQFKQIIGSLFDHYSDDLPF